MIVVFDCCYINFLFSSKTILNSTTFDDKYSIFNIKQSIFTIFDDKYSGDSFAEHQSLEGLKAN